MRKFITWLKGLWGKQEIALERDIADQMFTQKDMKEMYRLGAKKGYELGFDAGKEKGLQIAKQAASEMLKRALNS